MINVAKTRKSIIIIGDLHGRNIWKKITALHPEEYIVFIGDYFDSKDGIPVYDQISNFNAILKFKRENPNRVVLLLGNHDFHYLPAVHETYSGYQHIFHADIWSALEPALADGLMQICLRTGKYIISHAGLTRTWCTRHRVSHKNPVAAVNKLLYSKPLAFAFSPGPLKESTGDEPQQGPLWVRPESLRQDALPGFTQVVGHTQNPGISFYPNVICVDVFSYTPKYLRITNDGQAVVEQMYP